MLLSLMQNAMIDTTAVFLCQKNYSIFLKNELAQNNILIKEKGDNYVLSGSFNLNSYDFCFPHCCFINPVLIKGDSVNNTAGLIADYFIKKNKNKKIDDEWSCIFTTIIEDKSINNRINNVKKTFKTIFKKRMSRVSKLMKEEPVSYNSQTEGLFIIFFDYDKIYISDKAVFFGQKRMKDDTLAPSRSYLKVEEAYYILGIEPKAEETVCDLGASPGGWSYSASKRGAKVLAVDNGKLKKGALNDPLINHLNDDAFKFKPKKTFDWLFCDLVEHPQQVLDLLKKWLENGWCKKFIVNLKFGYVDPIILLENVKGKNSDIINYCSKLKVRHLYHDREEFTLTGILK